MAPPTPIEQSEPGAPIARDAIDPDLVKLARTRTKVGVVTALGLVILCTVFLLRLAPDRRFSASSTTPRPVEVSAVLAGQVETDQLVAVAAEPMTSHAIRATKARPSLGFRMAPARGTDERLWLVVSGDGDDPPAMAGAIGRLRKLSDLPFADAARAYATAHPRPVFATASALRAGLATGRVTTAGGTVVALAPGDAVEVDLVEPDAATIVASFNERLPDTAAWTAELAKAGVTPTRTGAIDGQGLPLAGSAAEGQRGAIDGQGLPLAGSAAEGQRGSIDGQGLPLAGSTAEGQRGAIDGQGLPLAGSAAEGQRGSIDTSLGQIRFSVHASVAETTTRLEAARLFDARVEPVTRHVQTTWRAVAASPATGLVFGSAPVPDAQIDLIGLYALRGIPDDAYAVVAGEVPTDYWYVLPITIALAVIALVFAWALIRAVRRDLLPTRA